MKGKSRSCRRRAAYDARSEPAVVAMKGVVSRGGTWISRDHAAAAKQTRDGSEYRILVLVETPADEFGLTPGDREERLPSGRQATFINRVH